jgi:hypothetical protein
MVIRFKWLVLRTFCSFALFIPYSLSVFNVSFCLLYGIGLATIAVTWVLFVMVFVVPHAFYGVFDTLTVT